MTFLVKCTCNTNFSKMPVTWINIFLQPLDKDIEVFCIVCHALIQTCKSWLKNLISIVQEVFSEKQATPNGISVVLNMELYFENPFSLVKLAPVKNFLLSVNYFCICFWVSINSLRTAVYWLFSHDLCSSWAEQIKIWLVLSIFVWLGLSEVTR